MTQMKEEEEGASLSSLALHPNHPYLEIVVVNAMRAWGNFDR